MLSAWVDPVLREYVRASSTAHKKKLNDTGSTTPTTC